MLDTTPIHRSGLSPRVRGNRRARHDADTPLGSIPACAGEPRLGRTVYRSQRVYPRVCGGTAEGFLSNISNTGLSPRVRGNLDEKGVDSRQRVYPRVCGGTLRLGSMVLMQRGLSPRVRGNRPDGIVHDLELGSIPACAGEPQPWRSSGTRHRVYPRVCGGTGWHGSESVRIGGLSPRVRGNPLLIGSTATCLGSIPACAGEPFTWHGRFYVLRVYPRVCGGT